MATTPLRPRPLERPKHSGAETDPQRSLRCFLAWSPDADVRAELVRTVRMLAATRTDPGYRWIAPPNLHLTLRFLGASSPAQLDAIHASVATWAAQQRQLPARVAGWQFWPSSANPRVLVLRIESGGALERLGADLEGIAQTCGFAPEPRAFRAHLTLARIGRLRERAMPFTLPPPPVAFTVDHVLLMRSDPSPPGNDYTELNRWTFGM